MTDQELINLINERFTYEPDTGLFRHKISSKRKRAGTIAGSLDSQGYTILTLQVNGKPKLYKAHRVSWLIHNGKWPDNEIDHINRDRSDNRISNLRDVAHRDNMNNMDQVDSAKGYYKSGNKYKAQIRMNGKQVYLGRFDNEEKAKQAYIEAREKNRR